MSSLVALWQKARAPAGDPARKGLPERCDREWFSRTFCGGADLTEVGPDMIWPHVKSLNFYDPLTLLAAVPACLKRFFKPVSKVWNGAEHIVIGTENDAGTGCIRDAVALRRFLLDSLKYSLAVSMGRFTGPPD